MLNGLTKIKRKIDDLNEYDKYYSHDCVCKNCGEQNTCYVEKGKMLDGGLIECDHCGCTIRLKSYTSLW